MFSEEMIMPCNLYGRNATIFNKGINNVKANIWISYLDKECNAKSLLGVLSMGLKKNAKVSIKTDSTEYKNVLNDIKDVLYSLV